jgi:hypothetical protein
MGKTLTEIAQELKNSPKKVQLIYAFNGTGKTRLSMEFKELVSKNEDSEDDEHSELSQKKILYYSAFTEDLFYWDNDLIGDEERKLKIHPNSFTNWILIEQGQDQNIISHFQRYTSDKLNPNFNENFSEVSFSFERGNESKSEYIKISKGEESNFIWCVFYALIEEVVNTLNISELEDRSTNVFNNIEYIFIDDPVTSLDENHLIELAVDLAHLIKSSKSEVKFIIATHNPLFYNVLHNELNIKNKKSGYKQKDFIKYRLEKKEDKSFVLVEQSNDSPFSYHLYLIKELKDAVNSGDIKKYHFNLLRNVLEKTSTFLGYNNWGDLFNIIRGDKEAYIKRIINLYSHSKHSSEEIIELTENDKRVFKFLVNEIIEKYHFNIN